MKKKYYAILLILIASITVAIAMYNIKQSPKIGSVEYYKAKTNDIKNTIDAYMSVQEKVDWCEFSLRLRSIGSGSDNRTSSIEKEIARRDKEKRIKDSIKLISLKTERDLSLNRLITLRKEIPDSIINVLDDQSLHMIADADMVIAKPEDKKAWCPIEFLH